MGPDKPTVEEVTQQVTVSPEFEATDQQQQLLEDLNELHLVTQETLTYWLQPEVLAVRPLNAEAFQYMQDVVEAAALATSFCLRRSTLLAHAVGMVSDAIYNLDGVLAPMDDDQWFVELREILSEVTPTISGYLSSLPVPQADVG